MNKTATKRIRELDAAKGIAITLVVIGHIAARSYPLENEWYQVLRNIIYSFHMPLFIFFAGITSHRMFERIHNAADYFAFIKSKTIYFARYYIFLSILIYIGKISLQQFIWVDNPIDNFTDFFVIFYDPLNSFSSFLWFIYSLVIFYALTPLLLKLFKHNLFIIFAIALAMHFINATSWFTLNRVFLFFIFYFSGYIVGKYYENSINHIKKYGFLYLFAFFTSLIVFYLYQINACQILAIPATLYIAYTLKQYNFLTVLGQKSYYIYLYNTIFIGLAKAILFLIIPWDGKIFILYFFTLTLVGLAAPIYLEKHTARRNSLAYKIKS